MHPSTPGYCYSNTYHHTHHPTMRDTSIHNKRAARYVAALIILHTTARDTSAPAIPLNETEQVMSFFAFFVRACIFQELKLYVGQINQINEYIC